MCWKHQRDRAGKSWEAESVWQRGLNEFLIPHCVASLFLTLSRCLSAFSLSCLPSPVFIVSKETRRRQTTSGFHGNQSTIKWSKYSQRIEREGRWREEGAVGGYFGLQLWCPKVRPHHCPQSFSVTANEAMIQEELYLWFKREDDDQPWWNKQNFEDTKSGDLPRCLVSNMLTI